MRLAASLALGCAAVYAFACAASAQSGLGGSAPMRDALPGRSDCLSDEARAFASAAAQANRAWFASAMGGVETGVGLTRYRLFPPQGGREGSDIHTRYWVDLDPSAGLLDHECTNITYNGHAGVDTEIRTFSEMGPDASAVGMPIFAAADGVVLFTDDGHPDRNESCASFDTNFVILGHPNGQQSWYLHMKRGSVAVSVGQQVVAGEQLGLIGSSGCSFAPHLHFETRVDGTPREAFAGDCNGPASLFVEQPAIDRALSIRDAAVTTTDPAGFFPPDILPIGGVYQRGVDTNAYLWVVVRNLPAQSSWRLRVVRPDGANAFETNEIGFNNSEFFSLYWSWWFADPSVFAPLAGEYRFQLEINGEMVVDAPCMAVDSPLANRAPNAIQSAAIWPASPEEGDVIACEIDVEPVNDDPDFDVLTFEYVWTVDDVEVRRVTGTGHKDVLARDIANAGQVVRCVVTASDGEFTTPSVQAQATVLTPCPNDTNGDRVVNFTDLNAALSAFGQISGVGGLPPDINLDGVVNFTDLNAILSAFGVACE